MVAPTHIDLILFDPLDLKMYVLLSLISFNHPPGLKKNIFFFSLV